MENYRILKALVFLVLVLAPQAYAHAYAVETHKQLSANILREYTRLTGTAFTSSEKDCILQGSQEEDIDPRYINHFFDPINNRGLHGLITGTEEMRSVDWATNPYAQGNFVNWVTDKQTKLFEYAQDYSWQRAIYEYAHGDKTRAMCSLGHVLHLLEDLTSVPHTRDDAHGPTVFLGKSSYYEDYTADKIPDVRVATIKVASSLEQMFRDTALYTNTNFLSRDTIFTKYQKPNAELLKNPGGRFVLNDLGVKLLYVDYDIDKFGNKTIKNTELNNPQVLSSYWDYLSRRSVNDGVALLDLFFKDVAQEKKTGALLAMNKSYYDTKRIVNALADERDSGIGRLTSLAAADVYELNKTDIDGALAAAQIYGIPVPTVARNSPLKDPSASANAASALLALDSATQVPDNADTESLQPAQAKPAPEPEPKNPSQQEQALESPVPPTDVQGNSLDTSPTVDVASTPGGIQPLTFGGGGVGGSGGGSSSASSEPTELVVEEPIAEPEPEPEPEPDTTPPDVELAIDQCVHSTSQNACVLTTPTDLHITWVVTADDVDHVTYQGVDTTDSEATDAIANNETKTFTVRAFDTSGNSATKSITVYVNTLPVVINEVAWSGTPASAFDEWIELYNRSLYAIDLSGWRIVVGNSIFDIPLSGSLNSGEYFLVKRKSDTDTDESTSSAIINVPAQLWSTWSGNLSDNGAVLQLTDNTDTVVDEVSLCSTKWCAGSTGGRSMERIRADETDDTHNWRSADVTVLYALDRSVTSMRGTPGARNIATGILASSIASDTTLTQTGSPYFVSGVTTVPSGIALTLQPGVIIKFLTGASQLVVRGTLHAEGVDTDPVILTSFADDEYAGDTNHDGATVPNAGAWHSVRIENGGVATLAHTMMRYGGRRSAGQSHHGALDVQSGGTLTADALTIEHAQEEGLYVRSGTSVSVDNSVFKNNSDSSFGYGIYSTIADSDIATITNSAFDANAKAGLYASGTGTYTITNNMFTNNGSALTVASFRGDVSGNRGIGNTTNGIVLPSTLGIVGTPTTLVANDLPYRITTTTTIPAGAEVSLGAGTRVESDSGASKQFIIDDGALHMPNGATLTSALATPNPGAWGGIIIKNGGTVDGSGVEVSYAGGNSFYGEGGTGVYMTDTASTLTLSSSTVQYNKHAGVFVADGTLTLTDTTVAHHTDGTGIDVRGGTATLTNITFDDNLTNTNPADLVP